MPEELDEEKDEFDEDLDDEDDEPKLNKSGKMGGVRPGAGRKKGSPNAVKEFKKHLRDYTTEKELKEMIKRAKRFARKDKKMLQFLLEQYFGKARQNMGIDGGADNKPITMAALLDGLEKPLKALPDDDGVFKIP